MSSQSNGLYEFGGFRLDARERLLTRDGAPVPLAPKAFDLLLALVEGQGRLLGKEELFQKVWPDSFVEESNLSSYIALIRKALSGSTDGERFIETVPKRGYRFIAGVNLVNRESAGATFSPEPISTESTASPEKIAAPSNPPSRLLLISGGLVLLALILVGVGIYKRFNPLPHAESLAVLPFSADPQTEYLSDGITESLINNLSRLSNLRVTARATALSYKGRDANPRQVGNDLSVGSVLTGRVTLRGDSLTVQVDLVDTATGEQKWGERYNRKLSDIFAVEEEIGRQITEKLSLRLSGAEQRRLTRRYTDNPEVYQLYLQGLYHRSKPTSQGLQKSVGYFQQTIAKDPNYAPAYTSLAYTYLTLSTAEGPQKLLPQAKVAARKALDIDGENADAYAVLGTIKWVYDLDATGAESDLTQALKLNPNSSETHWRYARVLADTGRFDEAHAQAQQAIELDPLSMVCRRSVPYIFYLSRHYDDAIAEYRKLIEIAPDFVQIQRELGLAYEQKGMYEQAFGQLQKAYQMPENYAKPMLHADLGHLYAVWGKRAEAQEVLAELLKQSEQSYVSAYDIAVIYAGLGDAEQAFRWLDKAVEQRPFWLCWLQQDPRLDALRRDARFRGLSERIKL